jgi:hypothetical protein
MQAHSDLMNAAHAQMVPPVTKQRRNTLRHKGHTKHDILHAGGSNTCTVAVLTGLHNLTTLLLLLLLLLLPTLLGGPGVRGVVRLLGGAEARGVVAASRSERSFT